MGDGLTLLSLQNTLSLVSVLVYKYQGADINENYKIYDVNCMDKKQ